MLLTAPVSAQTSPYFSAAPTSQTTETQNNQSKQQKPDHNKASQVSSPGQNMGYEKASQHQGGYDFYAKQILATSTSIIGTNIISQCIAGLKIPSIAVFMSGSLVYIASELAGAKAQNKNHNMMMDEVVLTAKELEAYKGGGNGDVQRNALELKKKEEEQTRDYLKSRRMWLLAVTAMYWTAMGLAIMEETSGIAAGVGTGTGICTGLAAQYAAMECAGRKDYPACYAAKYMKHFAACTGSMPKGWAQTLPNFANPASVQIAQGSCSGKYAPACLGYLNSYLAIAYAYCSPLSVGSGISGLLLAKAITAAYSMGISATGGSPTTGYITLMYSLFEYFIPALAKVTMASYNYPIPRAATFGASAALVTMITAGLFQRAKIAEQNIAKLNMVVNQFYAQTNDETGLGQGRSDFREERDKDKEIPEIPYKLSTDNQNTANANKRTGTCVTRNENDIEISEKACSDYLKVESPKFVTVEPNKQILNDAGQVSMELVDEINKGNTEKAEVLAGKLGSMLGGIKAATLQAQKDQNDLRKSIGMEEVNMGAKIAGEFDRFKTEYKNVINSDKKFASLQNLDFNLLPTNKEDVKSAEQIKPEPLARVKTPVNAADAIAEKALKEAEAKAKAAEAAQAAKAAEAQALEASETDKTKTSSTKTGKASSDEEMLKKLHKWKYGDVEDDLFNNEDSEDQTLTPDEIRAARVNGFYELERRIKESKDTKDGISHISDNTIFKQISYRYYKSLNKVLTRKKKSNKAEKEVQK